MNKKLLLACGIVSVGIGGFYLGKIYGECCRQPIDYQIEIDISEYLKKEQIKQENNKDTVKEVSKKIIDHSQPKKNVRTFLRSLKNVYYSSRNTI